MDSRFVSCVRCVDKDCIIRIRSNHTLKSLYNSADAVIVVNRNEYGTSEHPVVWHKWPYPTVGRPIGSGAGDATKPSNSLIRDTVAAFTFGPVHCLASLVGKAVIVPTRARITVERVLEYMLDNQVCCNLRGIVISRTSRRQNQKAPFLGFISPQLSYFRVEFTAGNHRDVPPHQSANHSDRLYR